jgi:hypothetical protein
MAHISAVAGRSSRPDDPGEHPHLVDHVVRTTHLPAGVARRVVDDVVAYFAEPVEAVVRRRHRELQAAGLANPAIYDRIAAELAVRPVAAPSLTARQIRRIVYG